MDKVFREKDLTPKGPPLVGRSAPSDLGLCPMALDGSELCTIRHKEFNKFIKGKGFKGRNNYKLRDLKAMLGFKPMITGFPVMISSDQLEPMRFYSMSKASTSTGIPYLTLLYAKRGISGIEFTLMEKNIQ